jgi:hypothetical protein
MLTGNWPLVGKISRSCSASPCTEKTETVLLPALTASSSECSASYTSEPWVGTLAMIVAVVVMILAVVRKRRRCDEGHNRDRENGSRGKAAKANHAIRGRSAGAVRRAGDSLQPIPAPLVTERGRGDCEADGRPRTLPPCPTATMRTTTSS